MSIPADTVTSRYTYEEMTNFTVVRLKTLLQMFGVQGLPAVSRAVMSTIIVGKMRERDQAAELDAQQNNLRRLEDAIRTKDEKIGEQGARLARVEKQLSDARKALVPWLAKKAAEAVVERKEADERDEKEIEEELLGSAESLPVPENTPTPDNNTPAAPSRPNKRQRSTPPPRENPAEDEGSVDAEPPTNRQRMDPEYVDVSSTPAAITPEFAPPITAPLRSNRPRSSLTASLDPILSDTPHADPAPFGYDSLGNIRKFPADLSRHCNGSLRERATVRGAVFLLLSLESESSASLASTSSSASSMQSESATGGRYYQECAQLGDEPAAESALRSEVYPYDDDIEMEAVNEYRH